MKTQLLEDIDDSGALPARPRPAVWHRPRFDAAPAAPLVDPAPAVPLVDPAPTAPRAEDMRREPDRNGPEPFAARRSAAAPQPEPTAGAAGAAAASSVRGSAAPDMAQPDWLADILRQDAELAAAARRPARWLPRLLAWGTATCVLALLAAGGLWLLEERQADGALTVAAASSPVPAPPVPRAMPSGAPAPVIVPAESSPVTAAPVTTAPVPSARSGSIAAAPAVALPTPPQAAPATIAGAPEVEAAARRERAPAKVAAPSKARAEHNISEQRRREETLVQCQAHGYDERQCVQRSCELTRYGLACRG